MSLLVSMGEASGISYQLIYQQRGIDFLSVLNQQEIYHLPLNLIKSNCILFGAFTIKYIYDRQYFREESDLVGSLVNTKSLFLVKWGQRSRIKGGLKDKPSPVHAVESLVGE